MIKNKNLWKLREKSAKEKPTKVIFWILMEQQSRVVAENGSPDVYCIKCIWFQGLWEIQVRSDAFRSSIQKRQLGQRFCWAGQGVHRRTAQLRCPEGWFLLRSGNQYFGDLVAMPIKLVTTFISSSLVLILNFCDPWWQHHYHRHQNFRHLNHYSHYLPRRSHHQIQQRGENDQNPVV